MIIPTKDFILVRPIADAALPSGLVKPQTAKDELFQNGKGLVLAIGKDALNPQYGLVGHIAVGSVVVVSKFGGTVIKHRGDELKLFRAIEILAVIETL